ncbi:MAG: hypothetical protein J5584_09750 [Clostridia bacterium]|nr:hypothetical protein [Clostridia bacterium]
MKKAFIIVLTLVLAAGMIMFAGCKKTKNLPADKLMTAAMSQTLDTMETKFAIDEARNMLKNGMFTFSIDIEDPEDPSQKFGMDLFLKDNKLVFNMDGAEKAIGIDFGAFAENFPKSILGTKGDNMLNIDSKTEQSIIDIVEKLVKEKDVDYSEKITDFVKEHGTMNAEYSVKTKVGGEDKMVNKLTVSFNKTQVEAAGKAIVKELQDNPLMSLFGMMQLSEDDVDLGDEYTDNDEILKYVLYTDVVTNEILGGELKVMTKDYEGATEYQTVELDTFQTDDSIRYDIKAHIDGEDTNFSALIQDNDSLKQVKLTVEGSDVFSFVADKAAKKVKVFFDGATEGLEFDYDVTRDAKGNVTYFSASFDLSKLSGLSGILGGMMPVTMYDSDYYLMEGGPGSTYGDYWDDDDWDDDWDDDDYGYGLFDIAGKLTITYSAEGDIPAFNELLKMNMDELQELVMNLFSMMGSQY